MPMQQLFDWLNTTLGLRNGAFDERSGRARYRAYDLIHVIDDTPRGHMQGGIRRWR